MKQSIIAMSCVLLLILAMVVAGDPTEARYPFDNPETTPYIIVNPIVGLPEVTPQATDALPMLVRPTPTTVPPLPFPGAPGIVRPINGGCNPIEINAGLPC